MPIYVIALSGFFFFLSVKLADTSNEKGVKLTFTPPILFQRLMTNSTEGIGTLHEHFRDEFQYKFSLVLVEQLL